MLDFVWKTNFFWGKFVSTLWGRNTSTNDLAIFMKEFLSGTFDSYKQNWKLWLYWKDDGSIAFNQALKMQLNQASRGYWCWYWLPSLLLKLSSTLLPTYDIYLYFLHKEYIKILKQWVQVFFHLVMPE